MALSYEEVAEILRLIETSSCDELVLELDDLKLVVRRHATGDAHPSEPREMASSPRPDSGNVEATQAEPAPSRPSGAPRSAETERRADGVIEVCSPMVGTFYRAPTPDAPPFVDVGSTVKRGDSLCLVEVMKLFTTISAQHDGRVVEVCAENGAMVEYGQPLFLIEPP